MNETPYTVEEIKPRTGNPPRSRKTTKADSQPPFGGTLLTDLPAPSQGRLATAFRRLIPYPSPASHAILFLMYKLVDPKVSFPKAEEEILAFWEKNDIFKQSIKQREGKDDFVFYDGPPFATGLPHFGHFVPSTIKDIIPRYQTMKGR